MALLVQGGLVGPWPVVGTVVALIVLGWILTRAIIAAASLRPPAMVAVSLSILTLVALGGFILTGLEVLATIAATGFGAIAGAMTSLFNGGNRRPPDDSGR